MGLIIGLTMIFFGGLTSAAWYLPLNHVKKWSWESGWFMQGFMAFLIFPWVLAFITVPGLMDVYSSADGWSIGLPILFGIGWGVGGLTWGLSIRYLGIGLGNALPLGITLSLATLIPIIFKGEWEFFSSVKFISVIIALIGVAVCGLAGVLKDKDTKKEAVKGEYNLKKGLLFALIGGVMSAFFAFGEEAGNQLYVLAKDLNPGSVWNKNAVFAVILIGGFTSNAVYCLYLQMKNKTYKNYSDLSTPLTKNFLLSFLAGTIWFSQFVFKGVATSVDESLQAVSWSLLFSLTIILSNIIGLATGEWKGTSIVTKLVLIGGLLLLLFSVIIVGV